MEEHYHAQGENIVQVNKHNLMLSFIAIGIISCILGAVFGTAASILAVKYLSTNGQMISQPVKVVSEQSAVTAVVKKANPAVVSIIISQSIPSTNSQSPFDFFGLPFDQGQQDQSQNQGNNTQQVVGGGTGFIVSSDGLILTNKHVVSDSTASYTVLMNDGTKKQAKVVGLDPTNDIALVKIDGTNLPTLPLGDSSKLELGQSVIAIGNALGEYQNTIDSGVVSGLNRDVTASDPFTGSAENLTGVIQTDAAINKGNSGGPLLDIEGNVVGMNTAIATGANNIGFAIPINQAKSDIQSVEKNGKIMKPQLGVRYFTITDAFSKANNLPYNYGALVTSGQTSGEVAVVPGSAADKAGIVENDIILEVNGQKVDSDHPLISLIQQYKVGDTIHLKVYHKGNVEDLNVTLQAAS